MTDTTFASPRLERPREAPLRGVCAALARTTGTDPVLWRVLAVVLTVFGGLGIALYLVAIATIPREGEQQALADRLVSGPDRSLRGAEWLLVVLLGCSLLALGADVDGLVALAVLGGLGVLWWRGRLPSRPAVPYDPDTLPGSGAVRVTDDGPTTAWPSAAPVAAPPPPRPRRARSPLQGLTVSLAAVVVGVLVLVGAQTDVSVPAEVVLAAALGTVGLGLVVGSWWGRSGWLIALAAVLGLALAVTAGTRPTLSAGVGERLWQPTAAASYRLGIGDATLDLTGLPVREGSTVAVDARVDVGHLLVLVPDGVRVAVDARAELGEVVVLGESVDGADAVQQVDLGPPGAPQVRLALSTRTGLVEVRRG